MPTRAEAVAERVGCVGAVGSARLRHTHAVGARLVRPPMRSCDLLVAAAPSADLIRRADTVAESIAGVRRGQCRARRHALTIVAGGGIPPRYRGDAIVAFNRGRVYLDALLVRGADTVAVHVGRDAQRA